MSVTIINKSYKTKFAKFPFIFKSVYYKIGGLKYIIKEP
jgi:hypothetical protein